MAFDEHFQSPQPGESVTQFQAGRIPGFYFQPLTTNQYKVSASETLLNTNDWFRTGLRALDTRPVVNEYCLKPSNGSYALVEEVYQTGEKSSEVLSESTYSAVLKGLDAAGTCSSKHSQIIRNFNHLVAIHECSLTAACRFLQLEKGVQERNPSLSVLTAHDFNRMIRPWRSIPKNTRTVLTAEAYRAGREVGRLHVACTPRPQGTSSESEIAITLDMFKKPEGKQKPGLLQTIEEERQKMMTQPSQFLCTGTEEESEDETFYVPSYVSKEWLDNSRNEAWVLIRQLPLSEKEKYDFHASFSYLHPFLERALDRKPNLLDYQLMLTELGRENSELADYLSIQHPDSSEEGCSEVADETGEETGNVSESSKDRLTDSQLEKTGLINYKVPLAIVDSVDQKQRLQHCELVLSHMTNLSEALQGVDPGAILFPDPSNLPSTDLLTARQLTVVQNLLNPAIPSLSFVDRFTAKSVVPITVKQRCLVKLPLYVSAALTGSNSLAPFPEAPISTRPVQSLGYFPHSLVAHGFVASPLVGATVSLDRVPLFSTGAIEYRDLLQQSGRSPRYRFTQDSFFEIIARTCRPQEDSGPYMSKRDRVQTVGGEVLRLNSLYYDSPSYGFQPAFPAQPNRVFHRDYDYASATHLRLTCSSMFEPTQINSGTIRPLISAMCDVDCHALSIIEVAAVFKEVLLDEFQRMTVVIKKGERFLRSERPGYPCHQLLVSPGKLDPYTPEDYEILKTRGFLPWNMKKAGRFLTCIMSGCGERYEAALGLLTLVVDVAYIMRGRYLAQCEVTGEKCFPLFCRTRFLPEAPHSQTGQWIESLVAMHDDLGPLMDNIESILNRCHRDKGEELYCLAAADERSPRMACYFDRLLDYSLPHESPRDENFLVVTHEGTVQFIDESFGLSGGWEVPAQCSNQSGQIKENPFFDITTDHASSFGNSPTPTTRLGGQEFQGTEYF
ncbi:unnamed protein product [Oikopleura dioica]|uniref:Uncharacterized protein n=1 Tax=Oikopleura dioica TaxID=34765 RepID=E4YPI3_OIKDI|nr:unnamed protein product [Oikopleura dioica]